MRHFPLFSSILGLLVFFFLQFGWEYDPLVDPTGFSLMTFAFLGNALASLRNKWKARNFGNGGPRDYETEIKNQFHLAICFLFMGSALQAFSRDRVGEKYEYIGDILDNNACGNIGGCESGPEGLKEMTPYSALFSTRFFSDLIESGGIWNITTHHEMNELCNYQSLIIPIILKTRYRVPIKKIWEYSSNAMNITCIKYYMNDPRGYLDLPNINITNDVDVNITDHSDFTARIGKNVMKFSMTCHSVNMTQTYERVEIKGIDKSENSCLRGFINFKPHKSKNLGSALRIAMEEQLVKSNQISHWKILVAHLLDEFQDPTNRYIRDLRIYKRVQVYLDKRGQNITLGLLIVSVFFILGDLFIPNTFLDFFDFVLSVFTDIYERISMDVPQFFGYEPIGN